MSGIVVQTYTLRILAPEDSPAEEGSAFAMEQEEQRVRARLPGLLRSVEEDLADLLPEGWTAQIREETHGLD